MNIFEHKGFEIAEIGEEEHSELMRYWTEMEYLEEEKNDIVLPDENIFNYLHFTDDKFWDAICAMEMKKGYHLFGQAFHYKKNALKWIVGEYDDTDELVEKDKNEYINRRRIKYGIYS